MRRFRWSTALALPGLCLAVAAAVPAARRLLDPSADVRAHFEYWTRDGGVWLTSNADYRTVANQEPSHYGTTYRAALGGVSMTGCLWGEHNGKRVGTYWNFFSGWDPVAQKVIVYQTGATGVTGMGYEELGAEGEPDVAEQRFFPTDSTGTELFRIKHLTTKVSADTLKTESFDYVEGEWQARRVYIWVRQPGDTTRGC